MSVLYASDVTYSTIFKINQDINMFYEFKQFCFQACDFISDSACLNFTRQP